LDAIDSTSNWLSIHNVLLPVVDLQIVYASNRSASVGSLLALDSRREFQHYFHVIFDCWLAHWSLDLKQSGHKHYPSRLFMTVSICSCGIAAKTQSRQIIR
jgi:hypothetical protein